ncbi:hypothetical protein HYY72_00425 [Candidatus Woesearchaeota archaeon]|nr:hypothetical protein [Candidatus Woesearchaeota archaeon]
MKKEAFRRSKIQSGKSVHHSGSTSGISSLEQEHFKSLNQRISELQKANDRLREHILLRDSVERAMGEEFGSQLRQKDEIIAGIQAFKIDRISADNAEFESRIKLKESDSSRQSEAVKLAGELSSAQERVSRLSAMNEKLREHILLRDSIERAMSQEFKSQLAEKDAVIKSIRLQKSVEPVERPVSSPRAVELEELNRNLREHILLRDSVERAMGEEFGSQLRQKDEIIKRLQEFSSLVKAEDKGIQGLRREIDSELGIYKNQIDALKSRVLEKENELKRLEGHYRDKEQSYDDILIALKQQLSEKSMEVEKLKSFVAEREQISQRIEEQLQRDLASREAELSDLRRLRADRDSLRLLREVEQLRQVLKLKEVSGKRLFLELAKARSLQADLEKQLDAGKADYDRIKSYYEKIVASVRRDGENAVKSLLSDYSSRDASAKADIERLKAELLLKESQIQVQKQRIDDVIREFNIKSQQLFSIREHGSLIADPRQIESFEKAKRELEEYGAKAESVKELLERRDAEISQKAVELGKREEEILSKESEIKGLLAVTEQKLNALDEKGGFDAHEAKPVVVVNKSNIESVIEAHSKEPAGNVSQVAGKPGEPYKVVELINEPLPPVQVMPEQLEEPLADMKLKQDKLVKPVLSALAVASSKPQDKTAPSFRIPDDKPVAKKVEMDINLQEQTLGYPEHEEIASMIDVALQHNESIEQIKQSLLSSGYSRENIEKALKNMKLA